MRNMVFSITLIFFNCICLAQNADSVKLNETKKLLDGGGWASGKINKETGGHDLTIQYHISWGDTGCPLGAYIVKQTSYFIIKLHDSNVCLNWFHPDGTFW